MLLNHPGVFLGVAALTNLPGLTLRLTVRRDIQSSGLVEELAYLFIEIVFDSMGQAVLAYAAFQSLRNERVTLRESMAHGLSRFLPVFVTAVLIGLIACIGLPLVVPGIVALLALFVAIPACVVERLGPAASLSRSLTLTQGHKRVLLLPVIGLGLPVLILDSVARAYQSTPAVQALIEYLCGIPMTAFECVLVAMVYHDLRVAKEGIDVERLVSVFD
jgi:hypothetical protein